MEQLYTAKRDKENDCCIEEDEQNKNIQREEFWPVSKNPG